MSKRTPDSDDMFDPSPRVKEGAGKYMVRPKQNGQISAATRYARELFLHGNGDGKPVRSVARLAEMAGVSTRTVEQYLPVWERESRALARAETCGKAALRASVTAESIQEHEEHICALKHECIRLRKIVPTLPEGTEIHRDTLKLYTATLKAWAEESGLHDHYATAVVAQRELIKQAARLKGKETSEEERNVTPGFSFHDRK